MGTKVSIKPLQTATASPMARTEFISGSSETLHFEKVAWPQHTAIAPRTVRTATLEQLIQCPDDPSPFPALTQLELWGTEA